MLQHNSAVVTRELDFMLQQPNSAVVAKKLNFMLQHINLLLLQMT